MVLSMKRGRQARGGPAVPSDAIANGVEGALNR
jgi:hypothetical protein